jgi:serine/threonine protein kinase
MNDEDGEMTFARRQHMKEEVQLAFRLHHPAIAQVHHFSVIERKPHIVMEYVDGPLLDSPQSPSRARPVLSRR